MKYKKGSILRVLRDSSSHRFPKGSKIKVIGLNTFTGYYKVSLIENGITDPVWKWITGEGVEPYSFYIVNKITLEV